jgi:hypothetical protein
MSASPQQNDFQAGFDLRSQATPSREQLIQAINGLAPLANIGGVVYLDSQNGASWPGVVSNPKFKRYFWIDTYLNNMTVRLHDQSNNDTFAAWRELGLNGEAIVDTHNLKNNSVTLAKINPQGGAAKFVLRINATTNAVEFVAPSSIFDTGGLPLPAIAGGNSTEIQVLAKDAAGNKQWRDFNFNLLPSNARLDIGRISSGGTEGSFVRLGSSGLEMAYPEPSVYTAPNALSASIAHTILTPGVHPKLYRLALLCTVNDAPSGNHVAGDEIDFYSVMRVNYTGGVFTTAIGQVKPRNGAIDFYIGDTNENVVFQTLGSDGARVPIDAAKWKVRAYVWPY